MAIQAMHIPDLVDRAHSRIGRIIVQTPLVRSSFFSAQTGANVFFKYESMQITGSFKARGVLSKLTSLKPAIPSELIAASTGNHGAAVAYASSGLGVKCIVFMPENASPVKIDAVRRLGAEVRFNSMDSGETEINARKYAEERGAVFVSPYNDPEIIGGQGTIGLELTKQLDRVDELFASVGGGGLVSGTAGYLKGKGSQVRVTGCSALNDAVLYASMRAGRTVASEGRPTIADGCAGGIEDDSITLPLVRDLVDEWCLVSEDDIKRAMRLFLENENQLLEGTSGLAIAAMLEAAAQEPARFSGKNVVIVICGSRLSLKLLQQLLS